MSGSASDYLLRFLGREEFAAEAVAKKASALEHGAAEGVAAPIPDLVRITIGRLGLPTALRDAFERTSSCCNNLEESYRAFLTFANAGDKAVALKTFRADHTDFTKALSEMRRHAGALESSAERKAASNAADAIEAHIKERRDVVEALGAGMSGAGHAASVRKKAAGEVEGIQEAIAAVERTLASASQMKAFPRLAEVVEHLGGVDSEGFRQAVALILTRFETKPEIRLMALKGAREEVRGQFRGFLSNVKGKLGEALAFVHPGVIRLRRNALKRALARENGLIKAGWSKSPEIQGAVRVTGMGGSTAGEFFDASQWMYRLETPGAASGGQVDAIAAAMADMVGTRIDGVAFATYGIESKAGEVGDLMKQLDKAGARSTFGVVELPIPGRETPGRFLMVPPPGMPTEIVLISPKVPSLEGLPGDIQLQYGKSLMGSAELDEAGLDLIMQLAKSTKT